MEKVKPKFAYQLEIGDVVNTRPKGKSRNEVILKITQNPDDLRVLDLITASGTYQAVKGSIVIP